MRQLAIKFYDWATAPLYRRLARDLTLQLQDISKAYVDQHEMLTAKMLDELIRMNLKLDRHDAALSARQAVAVDAKDAPPETELKMSEGEIWELLKEASTSLDVVALCAKHQIPVHLFYELHSKYRGSDPSAIRRLNLLEETNLELRRLVSQLMRDREQAVSPPKIKVENGNGRQ